MKDVPRIAVCGVEGNITEAFDATMEKMHATDEFDFERIKFIYIETFMYLLIYSKADFKIYLDNLYLCGGFPFSNFLKEEQIQEAKTIFSSFDYVIILCELYEWGGCTAADAAKFALEVGCKPFVIGTYPIKYITMLDKYADKVIKECDENKIPCYVIKMDSLFEKMKKENNPDFSIFTEAGKLMADKAIETVRHIIETGTLE